MHHCVANYIYYYLELSKTRFRPQQLSCWSFQGGSPVTVLLSLYAPVINVFSLVTAPNLFSFSVWFVIVAFIVVSIYCCVSWVLSTIMITSFGKGEPSKQTSQQRRYNVAATSWRCSDVVTTLLRRVQTHNVATTSLQRRNDVVATLCVCWELAALLSIVCLRVCYPPWCHWKVILCDYDTSWAWAILLLYVSLFTSFISYTLLQPIFPMSKIRRILAPQCITILLGVWVMVNA